VAFPNLTSCINEIAVSSDNDDELALLTREIADKTTYVHDQTILVEVLERDGHDVSYYERELVKERSHLATKIVKQFRLLEIASAKGSEAAASTQR
jgi:hypothetical protein